VRYDSNGAGNTIVSFTKERMALISQSTARSRVSGYRITSRIHFLLKRAFLHRQDENAHCHGAVIPAWHGAAVI
jgi:hypothetical protein